MDKESKEKKTNKRDKESENKRKKEMNKDYKEERTNKNGKKKKHIALKIFLIIIFLLVIAGIVFAYNVQKNGGGVKGVIKTSLGYDEKKELDKIYCLILGQSENLTDTIMLASYDPKTQEAALLSIPRDTFIGDNKAYASGVDKINAVYQFGAEKTLKEVRELTGIDVQYYLKVDTKALRALVDEIGGVYFDVPIDMHYTDKRQGLYIDLKAGYQLLDGDKAEQVVRFRHNSDGTTYSYEYGGEDLGRMKTQRAFLTALLDQTIKNMDISTIFSFLDIAEQYVETNLDFSVIKDYVPYIIDFKMDNLQTATLPGIAEQAPNGLWIYSPYEDEVEETINKLFYGIDPEKETDANTIDENTISDEDIEKDEDINIEVLNGSGSASKLNEVVSRLEAEGFKVTQTGNTSSTTKTTIIDRCDMSENSLTKIKEILGTENITSGSSDVSEKVTIIIGTDYVM